MLEDHKVVVTEDDHVLVSHGVRTGKFFDADVEDGVVNLRIETACFGAITLGDTDEFHLCADEVDELIKALENVRDEAWEYVMEKRDALLAKKQAV